jgi:hypothetical protein
VSKTYLTFLPGIGSKPPPEKGLHFKILTSEYHNAVGGEKHSKHSLAYELQVG